MCIRDRSCTITLSESETNSTMNNLWASVIKLCRLKSNTRWLPEEKKRNFLMIIINSCQYFRSELILFFKLSWTTKPGNLTHRRVTPKRLYKGVQFFQKKMDSLHELKKSKMRHRTADKTCIMHDDKWTKIHFWETVSEHIRKGFSEICNMVVSRKQSQWLCARLKKFIPFYNI